MEFRYYAIIVLGNVNGVRDIIVDLSETPPRMLQQTGVFIASFSTTMLAGEMRGLFEDRTVFIYEINDSTVQNIARPDIQAKLFGYITGEEMVNIMNTEDEINGNARVSGETTHREVIQEQEDEELSLEDKLELALEEEDYILAAQLRDEINKEKGEEESLD